MKRAPNGYRIFRWPDGFYHVYLKGGDCIGEELSRDAAIALAVQDKRRADEQYLTELVDEMKASYAQRNDDGTPF